MLLTRLELRIVPQDNEKDNTKHSALWDSASSGTYPAGIKVLKENKKEHNNRGGRCNYSLSRAYCIGTGHLTSGSAFAEECESSGA
jgi:hypothetical protein